MAISISQGWARIEPKNVSELQELAKKKLKGIVLADALKKAPGLLELLALPTAPESLTLKDPAILVKADASAKRLTTLRVTGGATSNLSFVKQFPNLEALMLTSRGSPKLRNLSGIESGTKIRRLQAVGHAATTLGPLSKLSQLREYIGDSAKALKSLDGLETCKALRHVSINLCSVTNLKPLAPLKELMALKARGTGITSLETIYGLSKLETLYVEKSKLKSIDGIAKELPKLKLLWLHSTAVKDIAPLGGLGDLLELDVAGLKVTDFSALAKLKKLKYLDVSSTKFADLDLLLSLPALRGVRLDKTSIRLSDPAVKKLNAVLVKRAGRREGGVWVKAPVPFAKLDVSDAPFVDTSIDTEEAWASVL